MEMIRFMRPILARAGRTTHLLPEKTISHEKSRWTFAHKRCKGVWRTYNEIINNDVIHGVSDATA